MDNAILLIKEGQFNLSDKITCYMPYFVRRQIELNQINQINNKLGVFTNNTLLFTSGVIQIIYLLNLNMLNNQNHFYKVQIKFYWLTIPKSVVSWGQVPTCGRQRRVVSSAAYQSAHFPNCQARVPSPLCSIKLRLPFKSVCINSLPLSYPRLQASQL